MPEITELRSVLMEDVYKRQAQNRLLINTGAVSDFSQRIQDLTAQRDAISVENPSSIMANTAGYFVSAQDLSLIHI